MPKVILVKDIMVGVSLLMKLKTWHEIVLKILFGADYANVQPHSGSQANMAVFLTFLNPGDTILGLDLAHGGHLTHGSPVNFSGQLYNSVTYGVDKKTGRVNFDEVFKIAKQSKPKMIICGGSAYPSFC